MLFASKSFNLLALSVLSGCLVGCAVMPVPQGGGGAIPASIPQDASWAADRGVDGRMRLAYYDNERRIQLYTQGDDAASLPFHPPGSGRASSGVLMATGKNDTFVAFRDKDPERDWFMAGFTSPQKLVGLGAETVPLARGALLRKGNHMAASWYGERGYADGKTYYVYYREQDDAGNWLSEPVELFKGIYPVTAITPKGRVTGFSWVREGADHQMLARTSHDGVNFSAAKSIADLGPITPIFLAGASAERSLVLWHAQLGVDLNDFRLDGAYSDDGANWTPMTVKALAGYDIETAELTSDHTGNVALVATIIKPEDRAVNGKYQTVLVLSHDGGANWSDLIQLRQDPVLIATPYAHARSAKAAFLGEGKLFVAWQDWRSLRSAVHFSYSEDAGKTWRLADQRLTESESTNDRLPQLTRAVFPDGKGGVSVVMERMNGDMLSEKTLRVVDLTSARLQSWKSTPVKFVPDEARLRKRVIEYWTALQAREFDKTYAMQDPYYRARVPYEHYKKELGRIDYTNPEVKQVDYLGPVALTVTKVNVELKPFMVNARVMKMDAADRDIPTRWLWIDGDWHIEFSQQSRELRYAPF